MLIVYTLDIINDVFISVIFLAKTFMFSLIIRKKKNQTHSNSGIADKIQKTVKVIIIEEIQTNCPSSEEPKEM